MPEAGKVTLKSQLRSRYGKRGPTSDSLPLPMLPSTIGHFSKAPDEQAVDFFHACEHLGVVADHAVAAGWYEKYRKVLLDDAKGVDKVGDPPSSRQSDDSDGAQGS